MAGIPMNGVAATPAVPPGQVVLVVDDEPIVREVLTTYLERDGFVVHQAGDGDAARAVVRSTALDLVLLDIMLPGTNGLDLLREVRAHSDLPVILLTARADEVDRVTGLELGADDYVVKPFSPREVAARVRSVLRRATADPMAPASPMYFRDLAIDVGAREVRVGDELADLTPKEFDLLAFLASHPRQVFSRAQLLAHVWDSSPEWQDPATVTVHIRRLRHKIEADPTRPAHLATVFGVGYRFEP